MIFLIIIKKRSTYKIFMQSMIVLKKIILYILSGTCYNMTEKKILHIIAPVL